MVDIMKKLGIITPKERERGRSIAINGIEGRLTRITDEVERCDANAIDRIWDFTDYIAVAYGRHKLISLDEDIKYTVQLTDLTKKFKEKCVCTKK